MSFKSNVKGLVRLSLKGKAYERGVQHGRVFKDHIQNYVNHMWSLAQKDAYRLNRRINETVDMVNDFCADIIEEIKGIADGSGLSFEKVFLFNNRDIWRVVESDSCSMFALRTKNSVIVGMNKDAGFNKNAPINNADLFIFQQSFPDKGYASFGYGHIGRVWGHGMNEHGLCTAGTAVMGTDNEPEKVSIGIYMLPRMILPNCRKVSEALELIDSIPHLSGGANFLIADETGDVVIVEMAPDFRNVRKISQDYILASNHFLSGKTDFGPEQEVLKESVLRSGLMKKILDQRLKDFEKSPLKQTQTLLGAHEDEVSVCRHNVLGFSTMFSWTALLGERQFLICNGYPCKNTFDLMN